MKEYKQALEHILTNGKDKSDRTGVGTRSVFGYQMRFNLQKGFPATTTKKLAWRAVVSELLWFLEGSGDERRLAEILHGTRDSDKKTIWTANAEADYWKPKADYQGDLGRVYGVQWRQWQDYKELQSYGASHYGGERVAADRTELDQIATLIEGIKRDPSSRRHIISAWNPAELDQMALPPCHIMSQFDVTEGRLSCQMYQRSVDAPLGLPFNIASYSLLTRMLAKICNLEVGEFIHTSGDLHIYQNQINGVKEQLTRDPFPNPILEMPEFTSLEELLLTKPDDYKLINYQYHPPIKFPFSV
jgi:thymidylate synthase